MPFRALTFILACCAAGASSATAGDTTRWIRFADPANHYAISLPTDWFDIPPDPGALEIRIADARRRRLPGLAAAYRREAETPQPGYVRSLPNRRPRRWPGASSRPRPFGATCGGR